VVNVPIPTKWVPEFDSMLMGGEAIVKGFTKKKMTSRRVPHWWVPTLRRTVVYSEILDSYMPVVVTKTLIDLVHKHKGFDNYILEVIMAIDYWWIIFMTLLL
jgi:large subunit ribosomal protein L28